MLLHRLTPNSTHHFASMLEPSINKQVALERLGGDEDLLREFVKGVFAEIPDMLNEIRSALASNDVSEAHRIAHGIKGMLATLEARPAMKAAAKIEHLTAEGRSDEASDAMPDLTRELDRLSKETEASLHCAPLDL